MKSNMLGNFMKKSRKDEYSQFREHLRRIRRRNKYYNITLEDLKKAWDLQEGICPYTKIKLENPGWDWYKVKDKIPKYRLASIDRIDPELGYVKGNIQFVSMLINFAKSDLTDKEMHEFLQIIREQKQ